MGVRIFKKQDAAEDILGKKRSAQANATILLLLTTSFVLAVLAIVGSMWVQLAISQYAENDYTYALQDVVNEIEGSVEAYRANALQFGNTGWVKKIAYMQGDSIDANRVTSYDLQEYRQQMDLFAYSANVFEMGLIFLEKDLVIGSSAKCDMTYLANNYIHVEGMDEETWRELCEEAFQRDYVLQSDVSVSCFLAKFRAMLMLIPVNPADDPYSTTMFVVIRHRDLERYFENLLDSGQQMYITVSQSGSETPFLTMGQKFDGETSKIEIYSALTDLCFSLTMPRMIVLANVIAVRNALLMIVGVLWLISMLINMALARHVFKPLRQLMNLINAETPLRRDINEFDSLQRGIEALKRREQDLRAELSVRQMYLRNAELDCLLNGTQVHSEEQARLAEFIRDFDCFSAYRVCLIFWEKEIPQADVPSSRTIEDALKQVGDACGTGAISVLRRSGHHILIVGYEQYSAYEQVVTALLERWEGCYVAIGSEVQTLSDIHVSYESAREAKDYRCVSDGFRVLRHDNVRRDIGYYLPQEAENRLTGFVRSGQGDKAEQVFRELYESNVAERNTTEIGMRNFMANVGLLVIKQVPADALPCMPPQDSVDDPEMMRRLTVEYIHQAANLHAERIKSMPTRMESILSYVDANLMDNTLSLNMVASHFNVSPSLISRLFAEQHGENFHTYVNQLRIARAMEYLGDENGDDIASVALKVGYTNDATFRRLFKRFAGVTPSEYRIQNHRE